MQFFENYKFIKRKKFIPGQKVYFSVSSEGLGHSSRILSIAKEFDKDEVVIGTYNYALQRFKNYGYKAEELPQELKLVGAKGSFDVGKTIIKSQQAAWTFNNIINKEVNVIRENGASCVIADGRLAPVLAADRLSLPCVVITNQSAFYPFFEQNSPLIKLLGLSFDWVMKTWLSSAEEIMIPDFPPPNTVCLDNLSKNHKVMKRTRFVGPLVSFNPEEIEQKTKPGDNYIVVTLGGHAYRKPLFDNVIETARLLKDYNFDIFSTFRTEDMPENVRIFSSVSSIAPFLNAADLVITQAGHSTAMEVLTLGKPSVIIPDFRQPEQENNAKRMQDLNVSIKLEYKEFMPDILAQTIVKIMKEHKYKNNAQKFKALAKEVQGSKRAAEVIMDYSLRLQCY